MGLFLWSPLPRAVARRFMVDQVPGAQGDRWGVPCVSGAGWQTTHFSRDSAVPWADPGAPFMWEGREGTRLYRCHLRGPYNNPCHRGGCLGSKRPRGLSKVTEQVGQHSKPQQTLLCFRRASPTPWLL